MLAAGWLKTSGSDPVCVVQLQDRTANVNSSVRAGRKSVPLNNEASRIYAGTDE